MESSQELNVFTAGMFYTQNSTISIPNTNFNEGQQLIFGATYSSLPGTDLTSGSPGDILELPTKCTGILSGVVYYAHKIGSNPDSFQLACTAPFGSAGSQLMKL